MVEVAGIWEQGWTIPLVEYNEWEMVAQEFGVDAIHMTPKTGVNGGLLIEYESIDALLSARPGLEIVFVDEEGETDLTDFEHPENALYVMGRVGCSAFRLRGKGHLSVSIPTPKRGHLWPHQALAIVLYDRERKK